MFVGQTRRYLRNTKPEHQSQKIRQKIIRTGLVEHVRENAYSFVLRTPIF